MEVRLAVQAGQVAGGKAGVGGMVAAWAVVETVVAERAEAVAVAEVEAGKEVARAVAMAGEREAGTAGVRAAAATVEGARAAGTAAAKAAAGMAVVEMAVARAAAKAVEACEHTQESRTGTFRRAHMVKYKRRGGCALGSCKR